MWEFIIVMFVVCGMINCVIHNQNPLKTFVQQQNISSFIAEHKIQIIDQGPKHYADTSAIRNKFMSMLAKND